MATEEVVSSSEPVIGGSFVPGGEFTPPNIDCVQARKIENSNNLDFKDWDMLVYHLTVCVRCQYRWHTHTMEDEKMDCKRSRKWFLSVIKPDTIRLQQIKEHCATCEACRELWSDRLELWGRKNSIAEQAKP